MFLWAEFQPPFKMKLEFQDCKCVCVFGAGGGGGGEERKKKETNSSILEPNDTIQKQCGISLKYHLNMQLTKGLSILTEKLYM